MTNFEIAFGVAMFIQLMVVIIFAEMLFKVGTYLLRLADKVDEMEDSFNDK